MNPRKRLILVTGEARTVSLVSAALELNGRFSSSQVFPDLGSVVAGLEQTPAMSVLVDLDPQPDAVLKEMDQLSRRFAETRFFVLSDRMEGALVLEAMRAGARQFLLKQSLAAELSGALERYAPPEPSRPPPLGTILTLLSAGGGCGCTTLAVNLASELHLDSLEPVLLVDMDADYGAIGPYLGLAGRYGLADVLAHKGQIDPQLIASTALEYREGMQALLSPASIDRSRPAVLEGERIEDVLEAARQAYAYTVVDAPRVSLQAAVGLAQLSLLTLVVLQLSVKDVKVARALLTGMNERGVEAGRLVAVVNRQRSRHSSVTLDDARKALGGFAVSTISNDYASTVASIDYGQPLSELAARSAVRRDIQAMAGRIVKAAAEARQVSGTGPR